MARPLLFSTFYRLSFQGSLKTEKPQAA